MDNNTGKEKFQDDRLAPMHTTEHIVNRTMINLFGCGRAISAHIEKKKSKLDYQLERQPSEHEIAQIERIVNDVIAQCLPVTTYFLTQTEAAERFDLKRLPDSPSSTVRIVKIGTYDECPCIGLHVANTSDIGCFSITSHSWDENSKCWRMRFRLIQPKKIASHKKERATECQ